VAVALGEGMPEFRARPARVSEDGARGMSASVCMPPERVAELLRCVLFSRDPISAGDLDMRTGYGRANIDATLTALQSAGHVELAGCTKRTPRWRMTERWADARPRPCSSMAHTLLASGFAEPRGVADCPPPSECAA